MNIFAAIIAGIIGTIVMTGMMIMAPRMGMPEMDIVGMLGTMFSEKPNKQMGLAMHMMNGIIFAIIYATLWNAGADFGGSLLISGIIFGIVQWLIVGMVMSMIPMMHTGIKAGTVAAPGPYMTNRGGMMAFMGGLMGHVVFGLVVGLVYGLLF